MATFEPPIAGELKVAGGANKLLEADFRYSEAEGKPKVAYKVTGDRGELSITQSGAGVHLGRARNNWNMRLANDVPMELKIEMGAGQGDLRLGGLLISVRGLEREGNAYVNHAYGKSPVTLWLNIEGGVGTINLEGS